MPQKQSQQTEASRPVYLRLMRRRGGGVGPEAEAQELLALLRAAPGAHAAQVIERHHKGGYRVSLDLTWSSLDAFITYLESHDWMSMM
jgi:hypothetical protein